MDKTKGFTHWIMPVNHGMPPFPTRVSGEQLEAAFPEIKEDFKLLTVSMFLTTEASKIGMNLDNIVNRAQSGNWYGLSWGCIHYYSLYLWMSHARNIFYGTIWYLLRRLVSFGSLPPLSRSEMKRFYYCYWVTFPVHQFSRAVEELIQDGYLLHVVEFDSDGGEVHMYYPKPELAELLLEARAD